MTPSKRSLRVIAPVLLASGVALVFAMYSPISSATPSIVWQPKSMYQSIPPGESVTVSATFSASEDARNVNVRVVPELSPYVTVSPSSFANVTKGNTYTVTLTIAPPTDAAIGAYDGTIQLRKGKLNLATPLPVDITVSPVPLPPDPGEPGKMTLEGIDSDGDGIRDDIQRWIVFNAYPTESGQAALNQYAKAMQEVLIAQDDDSILAAAHKQFDAMGCLYFVRGDQDDASELIDRIGAENLNTIERSRKYIALQSALGGKIFSTSIDTWEEKCDFDPWVLDTEARSQ